MPTVFGAAARKYALKLLELYSATPNHLLAHAPDVFKTPSVTVACTDKTGKCFVRMFSRGREHDPLEYASPNNAESPPPFRFFEYVNVPSIQEHLFPAARVAGATANIKIGERWVVLTDLAFCNSQFNSKYWEDEKFARFANGDFPVEVAENGSVLCCDLLHGYERGGGPVLDTVELAHIFGATEQMPSDDAEISALAFRDFWIALDRAKRHAAPFQWDLAKHFRELEQSAERNVLVLGSYTEALAPRWERTFRALHAMGWNPFELRNVADAEIQSNPEKMRYLLSHACFVIVIDDSPSGHIAELVILKSLRLRPVIVLRSSMPSTSFLEDEIKHDKQYFRVVRMPEISEVGLTEHVAWAKQAVEQRKADFNATNAWRGKTA